MERERETSIHIYIYIYTHTHIVCVCICVYVYVYIYIYISCLQLLTVCVCVRVPCGNGEVACCACLIASLMFVQWFYVFVAVCFDVLSSICYLRYIIIFDVLYSIYYLRYIIFDILSSRAEGGRTPTLPALETEKKAIRPVRLLRVRVSEGLTQADS